MTSTIGTYFHVLSGTSFFSLSLFYDSKSGKMLGLYWTAEEASI